MVICHLGLNSPFNENWNYQENLLPRCQSMIGNKVYQIVRNISWDNGRIVEVPEEKYVNSDGVNVIRIKPKKNLFSKWVGGRFVQLSRILEDVKPDIIFMHDIQCLDVDVVVKYVKKSNCILYIDNHADVQNSAKNIFSKYILHKVLWKHNAKISIPYVKKFFGITFECMDFLKDFYEVPDYLIEYLPLGGFVFSDSQYNQYRTRLRDELGMKDEILFLHSGKLNRSKKTDLLVESFRNNATSNCRLIIIGSCDDKEIENSIKDGIKFDSRIQYLGWKSGEELLRYLCAADVYAQPGTQSATMQNAACCRCALLLFPYESHKYLFGSSVVYASGKEDIKEALSIFSDAEVVKKYQKHIFDIAKRKLDYSVQADDIANLRY